MAGLSAYIVKLVAELIKHYAEKAIGENPSAILAEGLTDIMGETITSKISDFLDQGEHAKRVFEAFNKADDCFYKAIDDDVLKQVIISKPLAGLEQWEGVAKQLPSSLDDSGLLTLIRLRFKQDWPSQLTEQQLDQAALIYRDCLDGVFASKLDQLLPTIFRKVERIDKTSRVILENQARMTAQILGVEAAISRHQSDKILESTGMTAQVLVEGLLLPPPDSLPLQPLLYLNRESFLHELVENLNTSTWLALIDGPGKGKTQQAISIYHLYRDPFRCWISLRNKGDLAIKHIRDQMVRWHIQLTGQPGMLLPYQAGSIPFTTIVAGITEIIGKGGLLIVDDLPDPPTFEDLYSELEITARHFSIQGSKILTTGQRALPPLLHVNIPSLLISRSCPYFTAEDVQSLLSQSRAPKEVHNENIVVWIIAITKGHPSLVAATIRWLEQQRSQVSLSVYDGLISGEPVKDTLEYNRKVLTRNLNSSSKDLLYRLSLIDEKFGRKQVLDVANIPPAIVNTGEALENLIGPWLDRSTGDLFEVTPLLANSGKDNLPYEVQREIHLLVANQYLKKRTIDGSKAHTILMHLWQAYDYPRFASTLIQLLLSAKTRAQAKYMDWACRLIYEVDWPEEINLGQRIMIRAAQARTLALAGGKYQKINDDLELLLSQADIEEQAPALLFAYVNTGLLNFDLPVDITIRRAFTAFRLIRSSEGLGNLFDEFLEHLPNVVWSHGMRVKKQEHIKLFLQNINSLPQEDRDYFVKAPFSTEVSAHLIDQSWFSEASKPEEQQDWHSVLSFLDEISSSQYIQDYICFKVAIARSRAVVHADYLKQPDKAIEILTALHHLTNPDSIFLVNYSIGCIASDAGMNAQAIAHFTEAENAGGSGFAYYRLDNTKRTAIEKSKQQDWDNAKSLLINLIHRFSKSEGKTLSTWERYELFGELAFIHWSNGNFAKACAAMYGFVMGLVKEMDVEDPRYREAFNKAGHGTGWFVAISDTGRPPAATMSGDEYAPVQAGLFGIRRQSLEDFISPVGFSKAILLTQLAMFADAAGLLRMSWKLYKLALVHYRREDKLDSFRAGMIYPDLASLEAMLGHPSESLDYALQAKEVLAIGRVIRRRSETPSSRFELSMGLFSSEIVAEDYQVAEKHLLYVVFGPMLSNFIGENLNKTEIFAKLTLWEKAIIEQGPSLLYMDEWSKAIRLIGNLVNLWKEGQGISRDIEAFGDNTTFEIFRYLISSVPPNISLKDSLRNQLSATIVLPQYGMFARYMLRGIGKFIHRYWLSIAQTRRFALRHPQQFLDELLSTPPNDGGDTLARVLISAERALGINIPSDAREKLNQVKEISKPTIQKPDEDITRIS